ncbi:glycoside hydrolase family protein [Bradyrhizobium sp. I1.14.4]|uniref:glycoside hydrolase family protein n=1 Tax=unclassified Bradyrhizobium TaxID=2631580 RepID=UPI003D2332B1
MNAGNIDAAMTTLLQYENASGRQMAGLTRRRKAERIMFLGKVEAAWLSLALILSRPTDPCRRLQRHPARSIARTCAN